MRLFPASKNTILSEGEIPNGQILYKYARPGSFPNGQEEIPNGIFEDQELSCDWAKYQKTPESSFHIEEGKNIIIEITVADSIKNPTNPQRSKKGEVVSAWKQEIIHDPLTEEDDPKHGANDSHSLIKGSKKKAVTDAIKQNSEFRNLEELKKFWK